MTRTSRRRVDTLAKQGRAILRLKYRHLIILEQVDASQEQIDQLLADFENHHLYTDGEGAQWYLIGFEFGPLTRDVWQVTFDLRPTHERRIAHAALWAI